MQQPVSKSVATAIVVAKTLRFFMITVFNVKLWPSARNPRSYHFYLVATEDVAGISGVAPPPKFFHPFGVLLYGLIPAEDISSGKV